MKKIRDERGECGDMVWTFVVANGGSSLIENRDNRAEPFIQRGLASGGVSRNANKAQSWLVLSCGSRRSTSI